MSLFLRKMKIYYHSINRNHKRIFVLYTISVLTIFLEVVINFQLDFEVYFHPLISLLTIILLIIDLFFVPCVLLISYIRKQEKCMIKGLFEILISNIGMGIFTLICLIIFSFFHKSVFHIDTEKIEFTNDKIRVEERVWLEISSHVEIYQGENIFFVRRIDGYKS